MYIVLDLETASLKPAEGAIIEIALLKVNKTGKIIEKYQTLINPEQIISAQTANLTQIQQKDLEKAPKFSKVRKRIKDFIKDYPIIGHNIGFDLEFLKYQGLDLGDNEKIDTWLIFSILYPKLASTNLEYLAQYFKLKTVPSHRAMTDAKASLALFIKAKKEFPAFSALLQKKILNALEKTDWHGKPSILELFSSAPASSLSKPGHTRLSAPNQLPASICKGEKELLKILIRAFKKQEKWIIESQPGLTDQKILAEFLSRPNLKKKTWLFFSQRKDRGKFIQTLRKALSSQKTNSSSYSSLLAQKEYLCLKKFNAFFEQKNISREQTVPFLKILVWQDTTRKGEIEEIQFIKDEHKTKQLFIEDSSTCPKKACPFYKKCYFFKALKSAKKRKIILSSHNLLAQGLKKYFAPSLLSQSAFIALQAEDLEKNISYASTQRISINLLLKRMQSLIDASQDKKILSAIDQIKAQIKEIEQTAQALFPKTETLKYNLSLGLSQTEKRDRFREVPVKLQKSLQSLAKLQKEKKRFSALQALRISEITQNLKNLKQFFTSSAEKIYWLTLTAQYDLLFNTSPLRLQIKDLPQTALLIGQSLSASRNDFSYLKKILNLKNFKEQSLACPIDYTQASRIFLVKDLEQFSSAPSSLREKFLIKVILKTVQAVPQKTIVVLQNYQSLQQTYKSLLPLLDDKIMVLAQGSSGGQNKVISKFKQEKHILLLATQAYLDRLKLEDKALKCIILNKIIFDYLGDPVISARQKSFANGFIEFILPRAVLKFKKIFNSLISYPQDQGILILLDEKLWIKNYGKDLINGLPCSAIKTINLANLSQEITEFLQKKSR